MEIQISRIERSDIVLQFEQNLQEGIDDITPLVNSLKKIKKIINEPGFRNKFSKKEKELWQQIFDEILEEEQRPEGVQNL